MSLVRNLTPAALMAALLIGGAAQAQGVMAPGAVPPPPSFRDTAKPADGQAQKRRARKPAQADNAAAADGDMNAAPRRKLRAPANAADGGYAGRIDDRPQRAGSGGMQLEDDPRAVTPVLNNGRAGMGMRF
jgi:hypothetical protein